MDYISVIFALIELALMRVMSVGVGGGMAAMVLWGEGGMLMRICT